MAVNQNTRNKTMNHAKYREYLNRYNRAVQRYARAHSIPPEEVVDLISIGELELKEVR